MTLTDVFCVSLFVSGIVSSIAAFLIYRTIDAAKDTDLESRMRTIQPGHRGRWK